MYTDIYNTHLKKTDMQDEQDQFFFVPSFIPGIIEFIYINGILLNTNETTKFQCNNYNISFIQSLTDSHQYSVVEHSAVFIFFSRYYIGFWNQQF